MITQPVIANEAKRSSAESTSSGLPRHLASRNDVIFKDTGTERLRGQANGAEESFERNESATLEHNQIITFGCRLNIYESEVIRNNLDSSGVRDAIVFNTCAVTSEAERQARQAIRRARRENPGKKIIVTGCAAQINPGKFEAMPEVDNIIGNQEKLEKKNFFGLESERVRVNDIMELKETALHMTESFDEHTRAFVQVQNGCNHRCTFCIIPYGRGNSRSVPVGDIVTQVRKLVEIGFKEVVVTGVDITSYGYDLPGEPSLGNMLKRLLKLVPELPRLRLSSIDAVEVDNELLDLIADEPRLMPHLHISLQAGDDLVLKRMKRRHLRKDALNFCKQVRSLRPDVVFGADIIAGFPTEDNAMFENTRTMVEEAELTYLHIFPYSEREGTPAAKMPQVPKALRKERAAILRGEGNRQLQKFLASRVGKVEKVLVENNGSGRTEHFAEVVGLKDFMNSQIENILINNSTEKFLVAS